MQYTDKNLTYIQNNENCENHEFLRNKRNIFTFVKIRNFSEFLKFVKFAFSTYVLKGCCRLVQLSNCFTV